MTTLHSQCVRVQKWRKKGRSFEWIGSQLGVSRAEARRLLDPSHVPGAKVKAALGIGRKPYTRKPVPRLGEEDWEKYYLKKLRGTKQ